MLQFLIHCLILFTAAFTDASLRTLAQKLEILVTDENANQIEDLISGAELGTTILISTNIKLRSVITVSANRITIRGESSENRPEIRCHGNSAAGFKISSEEVEFVNLVIRDCHSGSAPVNIGVSDPFTQQSSKESKGSKVTFRNVDFLNNGGMDSNVVAGAIFIGKGHEAVIRRCRFVGNRAPAGGAIHADGALLMIKDSTFDRNIAQTRGGAIHMHYQSADENRNSTSVPLYITSCEFNNNKVLSGQEDTTGLKTGGGIDLESNPYLSFPLPSPSGGALNIANLNNVHITRCTFDGNSAVPAGGAIFMRNVVYGEIINCVLHNNFVHIGEDADTDLNDLLLGGGLFVATTDSESDLRITATAFENNTAAYGGALHLVSPSVGKFSIEESSFSKNVATIGGGAMLLRNINTPQITHSNFTQNSAHNGGAILVTNGGGLRTVYGKKSARCTFRDNVAFGGGAIIGIGSGVIQLYASSFIHNNAEQNGGALCVVDSTVRAYLILSDLQMLKNKAERGGAVYVENIHRFVISYGADDNNALFAENRTIVRINDFFDNKAVAGGAIYYKASNLIHNYFDASRCRFIGNRAHRDLSAIFKRPLEYPGAEDHQKNGIMRRLLQIRSLRTDAIRGQPLIDPLSTDPCYPGGGGAVCFALTSIAPRAPVAVVISNSQFENNSAIVAGGLFVATDQAVDWKPGCPANDDSTSLILTRGPCRSVVLRLVNISNNFAHSAGGGMFASNLSHVYYSDVKDYTSWPNFSPIASRKHRKIFKRNSVGIYGYGSSIAGNAAQLNILQPLPNPYTGLLFQDRLNAPSESLDPIKVEVLDDLGQVLSGGVVDSRLKILVSALDNGSNSSIVSGQVESNAREGIAEFHNLILSTHAGNYVIEFLTDRADVQHVSGIVNIRECLLGEITLAKGSICQNCPSDFFTYKTDKNACDPCPANAECKGGASVVPVIKYWHSSPFSTIMHECYHPDACVYPNRTETLETLFEQQHFHFKQSLEQNENSEFNNTEYKQCANGYDGPLCGSCAEGYGHADGKSCKKCASKSRTAMFLFFLGLWQLVLLSITIRSALCSIRDMSQMISQTTHKNITVAGSSASSITRSITRRSLHNLSGINPTDPSLDNHSMSLDHISEISESQPHRSQSISTVAPPATQKQQSSVDYIIAAQNISETIKIFINFFQVTSVAVNINVHWSKTIKNMLTTMNSVAGFSNGAAFTPMTCLLGNSSDSHAIYGVVMRIAFTLCLTLVLIVFFLLQSKAMMSSVNYTVIQCFSHLQSRLIISFLVVVFYSYQSISEDLMGTVSCIKLDNKEVTGQTLYPEYSIARDLYWTEDTNIRCFEDKHTYLAALLGIPGIVFFIIGFPLFVFVLLICKRSQGKLMEVNVLNKYGFVYQNYEEKYVYWEVCILLRKALIGAIVVFAYPLGANLQGMMAIGVLILALVIHLIATPFKYLLLNILEGFSLLVTIFTFYTGVVFNDENTTYTADILLSTLLVLINAALMILFFICIFKSTDRYIVARLKYLDADYIPDNFLPRVWKLIAILSENVKTTLRATNGRRQRRRAQRQIHRQAASKAGTPTTSTGLQLAANTQPSPLLLRTVCDNKAVQTQDGSLEHTEIQIELDESAVLDDPEDV